MKFCFRFSFPKNLQKWNEEGFLELKNYLERDKREELKRKTEIMDITLTELHQINLN